MFKLRKGLTSADDHRLVQYSEKAFSAGNDKHIKR